MDHLDKLDADARILKVMIGGLYVLAVPVLLLVLRIASTVGAFG